MRSTPPLPELQQKALALLPEIIAIMDPRAHTQKTDEGRENAALALVHERFIAHGKEDEKLMGGLLRSFLLLSFNTPDRYLDPKEPFYEPARAEFASEYKRFVRGDYVPDVTRRYLGDAKTIPDDPPDPVPPHKRHLQFRPSSSIVGPSETSGEVEPHTNRDFALGCIIEDVLARRFGEAGKRMGKAVSYLLWVDRFEVDTPVAFQRKDTENEEGREEYPRFSARNTLEREWQKAGIKTFNDIQILEIAGHNWKNYLPLKSLVGGYEDVTPVIGEFALSDNKKLIQLDQLPEALRSEKTYDYIFSCNVFAKGALTGKDTKWQLREGLGGTQYAPIYDTADHVRVLGNLFCVMANKAKPGGAVICINGYHDPYKPVLNNEELHALAGVSKDTAATVKRYNRETASVYRKSASMQPAVTPEAFAAALPALEAAATSCIEK